MRHLKGLYDIRKESLALGTRGENMMDIPAKVRSRAASAGRSARSKEKRIKSLKSVNIGELTEDIVRAIRITARRNSRGFLFPGELERLSKRFGKSEAIISNILRNVTYSK